MFHRGEARKREQDTLFLQKIRGRHLSRGKRYSYCYSLPGDIKRRPPAISFTVQVANNNKLPFIGIELAKMGKQLKTCVYRKPTIKGPLLHYQSHVDARSKRSLLMTMLNRARCLSSSPDAFAEECDNVKTIFLKLTYPEKLINSTITKFIELQNHGQVRDVQANAPIRIILPFKDQRSGDVVRRQLSDLGKKINSDLRPVSQVRKLSMRSK